MRDERKVSFLEKIAVAAVAGAAGGALSGAAKVPEESRKYLTDNLIDLALYGAEQWKDRDKKGYFNG